MWVELGIISTIYIWRHTFQLQCFTDFCIFKNCMHWIAFFRKPSVKLSFVVNLISACWKSHQSCDITHCFHSDPSFHHYQLKGQTLRTNRKPWEKAEECPLVSKEWPDDKLGAGIFFFFFYKIPVCQEEALKNQAVSILINIILPSILLFIFWNFISYYLFYSWKK